MGRVYELPKKKRGPTPSLIRRIAPLTKRKQLKYGAGGLYLRSQKLPTIADVSDSRRKGFPTDSSMFHSSPS